MVYNTTGNSEWGARMRPLFLFYVRMNIVNGILIVAKYAIAIAILVGVWMAPAWVARQTSKDGYNMVMVRLASWLLFWTGIGWLWALFCASKK